ncbi:unnamed protein product [Bursaphelenchus okinawaensis]|uniref:Alpha-mannosidase n=1 Tax=Bursaphelenchus okinawaensis TaxID=465554 RepID=A0A811KC72_9BILA|nr:unnamed protein product [Bursaphelenchus okinawaensis]CAG9100737.1 unnamed protein product [Bursaphelenchus okinawaensis]
MHKWLATCFSLAALFLVAVFIAQNETDQFPIGTSTIKTRRHVDQQRFVDIKVTGNEASFQTQYNRSQQTNTTLNVFLVFHSHTDPGWLRTFNEYFDEKVQKILDLAVDFLTLHSDAKFIWSEMSFLSEWWDGANSTRKEQMVRLVQNGQLELSGGTWVMSDEAITHFWASIDNIIEGHNFVQDNFKVRPTTSWSVDPFGHGSTMPYLLNQAGVDQLVVGRLSKHVKEEMIRHGALKFLWSEPWNNQSHKRRLPLISSLPRTYYTTADSCGPDGQICCQFDFGPSARSDCFQRFKHGNDSTAVFAKKLVNQYRKLQTYYRSNSLLVPIGDDFFFSNPKDWTENYDNYKALMTYINSHEEFNMKIQFGTVADYFNSLKVTEKKDVYPVVDGDFFPYTEDMDGAFPYWTGYYGHRPFFKKLERIVQNQLRRLDYLLVRSQMYNSVATLSPHRRTVSLVQHHDAITATSRPHVMTDYEDRLFNASIHVQKLEAEVWARRMRDSENITILFYQNGREIVFDDQLKGLWLTIYNPRTFTVNELIKVRVNNPNISVKAYNGKSINAQILPYLNIDEWKFSPDIYELVFYVELQGLESRKVFVEVTQKLVESTTISTVFSDEQGLSQTLLIQPLDNETFTFENSEMEVSMENGYVKRIINKHTGKEEVLDVSYGFYTDMGGAYVFAPISKEKEIEVNKTLASPIYVTGSLISRAYSHVRSDFISKLNTHQVFEFESKSEHIGFSLELYSNVEEVNDATVVMNVNTKIESGDSVYSDVNGMYLRERTKYEHASTPSANYYPAATSVMIQDKSSRLTVAFAQPTGIHSPKSGQIQLVVDRILSGDDGKGLSYEDAAYTEPARLKYRFRWEERYITHSNMTTLYHSHSTHKALASLLLPVSIHNSQKSERKFDSLAWPCDVEMINVRYLNSTRFSMSFRKLVYDGSVVHLEKCQQNVDLYTVILRWMAKHRSRAYFSNLATTKLFNSVTAHELHLKLDNAFDVHTIVFIRV